MLEVRVGHEVCMFVGELLYSCYQMASSSRQGFVT